MSQYGEEQAVLNRIWSQLILEELSRFGVRHVCIAPGSRSTPLTLEANAHTGLEIHPHFDERGLGFMALGMAKASREPIAIVVTSGTAVANLLPAIAESKLTGEKLVVLTADRPTELIDCGANQAISQSGIFSSHVTRSLELPSPSRLVSPAWLLTSVDQALSVQAEWGGAVHINCPFPEPLYTDLGKERFSDYLLPLKAWQEETKPFTSRLPERSVFSVSDMPSGLADRKGLVVVGSLALEDALQVRAFAESLGFPLLCDPQSGISSDWAHFDLWLQVDEFREKLAECDMILQFGARIVSKRLNAFIRQQGEEREVDYWLISSEQSRLNPDHLRQTHIATDVSGWVQNQLSRKGSSAGSGWADNLKPVTGKITEILRQDDALTELNFAVHLSQIVDSGDLFIGNSLIVRLVDMVSVLKENRVYSNRGASGIDGLIATAAGVQKVTCAPLTVLIGDTSLLYDINSLALLTHVQQPVVIIVTNNDGGAIFDLLPVPKQQKKALYQMPHGYTFEHAAKQFGLAYCCPASLNSLKQQVNSHLTAGKGALVVEVQTPPEQASDEIRKRIQQIHALH